MNFIFKKTKALIILLVILALIAGSFFYFRSRVYVSTGGFEGSKEFRVKKGEGIETISENLIDEDLISAKIYFYYYLWTRGLKDKILPGKYVVSGNMKIPELVVLLTHQDENIRVTFPEGWTSQQMAERLKSNGFSGNEFLSFVENPDEFRENYEFLQDENVDTLEGYLFPDTYFFNKDFGTRKIAGKMLDNFDQKLTADMRGEISSQGKSVHQVVAMASIIEGEVKTKEDREIVSGIFWDRITYGQPLESCATIAYVLGERKKQYSEADTKVQSPYNTYENLGLPPGPISNPGLESIEAAIYPQKSKYNYFLNDPGTGKTVFSVTYEEHNANKAKYGL